MEVTLKQQEEVLMREWREMLQTKGILPISTANEREGAFNADGIVDHEKWNTLQVRNLPKLLFILKETDQLKGSLIEPLSDHGGNGRTWAGVAKWADALLFGKYRKSGANRGYRKEIISNIAAINVKKYAGGTSSVREEIDAAIERNKEFLKRQIELYQPNVIVGCWHWHMATAVVNTIMQEALKPQWEWFDTDKKMGGYISYMFGTQKPILVIDMRHPCMAGNKWADKLVALRKSDLWKTIYGEQFLLGDSEN